MSFLQLFWYDGSLYQLRIPVVSGVEVFLMSVLVFILIRRMVQG
jgi:hypothetical protein